MSYRGSYVPDLARRVRCPKCGALEGQSCRHVNSPGGEKLMKNNVHTERRQALELERSPQLDGVVRPDGSVTFSPGYELTEEGKEALYRSEEGLEERRATLRNVLPPEVVRELERLKCFRGSQLGRVLEGRAR